MSATNDLPTPPLRHIPRERKGAGLILPLLLVVIGIVVAVWGATKVARTFSSSGFRFEIPGEQMVTISKPGEYRLWLETRSIIDGSFHSFPETLPQGAQVTVLQIPEGNLIEQSMSGNMQITVNGVRRHALTDLTLPEPGEYVIKVSGTDERRFLYLDEALSFAEFFKAVGLAILGRFLLVGGAIWIIILLAIRTSKR